MSNSEVEERRDEILSETLVKTLFSLAWPVMVGSGLWILYGIIDAYWIGKVGKEVMAAVTASWPIYFLAFAVAMGLASAGVSLVSQHTGAGDYEKARKAAGQTYVLLLFIGTLIGILGFFTVEWFLATIIKVPREILSEATSYMQIIFIGLPFVYTLSTLRFLLRGIGDMKTSMYLRSLYIILNIVVDPFLILGIGPFPQLGVKGVALALVSTRSFTSLVGSYLLFTGKVGIKLNLDDLKPQLQWFKKIFNIGVPATVARSGNALSYVLVMSFISRFGTVTMSGYGIGRRISRLINIFTWGIAGAVMTMVGQNIGAEQQERGETIVKKAIITAGVLSFSTTTLLILARYPLMQLFTDNVSVIRSGAIYITIYGFSIPFYGFFRIFDSTYRGTGHTKSAMILSLVRVWIFRVAFPYLLAFNPFGFGLNLGIIGVWWGMTLSNIFSVVLSYGWFLIGKWKQKTIYTE